MSKKKRLEEQRRQEELERKSREVKAKQPTASWRHLSTRGPVPVAPPADFIQLTPIVQPIPLVPYSSQLQPLALFDEDDDDYYY